MTSNYSSIFITDAYEHRQYASFGKPLEKGEKPADCQVTMLNGAKVICKSEDEFNQLAKQYMQ